MPQKFSVLSMPLKPSLERKYDYQSMNESNSHEDSLTFKSNLQESLNTGTSPPWLNVAAASDVEGNKKGEENSSRYQQSDGPNPSNLNALVNPQFYKQDHWIEELCDVLFKLKRRGATIKAEVYYGVIHFISCLYVLAVVPQQLQSAGYDGQNTVVAVALCSGVATIFCGLFANLPFVLAPPTVVSIFLSVFLQQSNLAPNQGNIAVILSGALLILFGWKPLGRLTARLIPVSIQVGTAIGIGLLTALAGAAEIDFVTSGSYSIVQMGYITPKIVIAITGVIIIAVTMFYHVKGSFALAVVFCSIVWWIYDDDFPTTFAGSPSLSIANLSSVNSQNTALLVSDLIFLYVLYLNGLMTSLSNLAVLTREDSTIPRGRWIFIMAGVFTMIAGVFCSAPILISPESSASIKAGAKTGLSAVVCGVLFLLSLFFAPLFQKTPAAGTSPVLIMIGIILFQNCSRIDWRNITAAAPAFVVLFFIPFTYSVIQGVVVGYVVYLCVNLLTGELLAHVVDFTIIYFPKMEGWLTTQFNLRKGGNSKGAEDIGLTLGNSDSDNNVLRNNNNNNHHDDRQNSYSGSIHTLFDDPNAETEHIVSADMGSLHFGDQSEPTMSVIHSNFLDFGTDLRPRPAPSRTAPPMSSREGEGGEGRSASVMV